MTELMKKHDYRGWYIGIMHEDTYADRYQETTEFGPFSKSMATRTATIFNKVAKKLEAFKKFYAVAISGREVLAGLIQEAERKAGWSRNP